MNFSTNILLSPEENDRYQAVYASQQYGTFYGIYGRFQIEKKQGETFLHRIDLKLINYKGMLNMSMDTELKIDPNAKELLRNLDVILLKVKVRAKLQDANYESSHSFRDPIRIHKGTYFSVISELIPLCGTKDPKKMTHEVGGVFDNEFYYKDGMSYTPRLVTGIALDKGQTGGTYDGYKFQSELLPPSEEHNDLNTMFSSIRCAVGNSRIIVG
jgi:hypothetical protein